ncbi:hypothetical protein BH24ACT12_BH24ACT12_28920 [soil metagenome]
MSEQPLVLVTVGSDHHPFDRLVEWVDRWLAVCPVESVRCVIQYGTSRPPQRGEGLDYLGHHELLELMARADVIVTQGGPMSIMEARRAGLVPIVVSRDAALGEHVDNHQQAFCSRLARGKLIRSPSDATDLGRLIDLALEQPKEFATTGDETVRRRVDRSTQRLAGLVRELTASSHDRPRVLMIAGSGRSGSTLFERALAGTDGVTALGETVHMWDRAVRDDELCGCGRAFAVCPFWSAVGDRAFGGWSNVDADEMVELRHAVVRTRYLPRLLGVSASVQWRLQRDRLARRVGAVMRAAAHTGRGGLLVDSSKMPAYAGLLSRAGVDLRCVLVVRDPRGVAYSMRKEVQRPEADDVDLMHRTGAGESALWWSAFDVAYRTVALRRIPVVTVRYEDFVARPREEVRRVLAFAGEPAPSAALSHLGSDGIRLEPTHQVAGNPVRFASGLLPMRADDEWRDLLPAGERRVVNLLTVGLRHRYGYH